MSIINIQTRFFICVISFIVLSLISTSFLYARIDIPMPPDSAEIRKNELDKWLQLSVIELASKKSEVYRNSVGQVFQIRVEETSDSYVIAVVPFVNGSYTISSAGCWFLYRNKKTGEPSHIRVYPLDTSELYVQLYPSDTKVFADFLVYDVYAVRGVPLGIGFEQLYTMSLDRLRRLTAQGLPWEYTDIMPQLYDNTRVMIDVIRNNISRFEYLNDAGYNDKGEPVFISNEKPRPTIFDGELNGDTTRLYVSSAGFVKWIIDGLVKPLVGNGLIVNSLKAPTVLTAGTHMEPYITSREPYFLLDWIRHLASGYISASSGRTLLPAQSGADVTIEPFSERSVRTTDGSRTTVNSVGYLMNAGYRIEHLKALLYVLAITEPDRFFLGAVRVEYGTDPVLPQFLQTIAFFPYFDADKVFKVVMFANGTELLLDNFITENKGNFIHLERAKASADFYPQ